MLLTPCLVSALALTFAGAPRPEPARAVSSATPRSATVRLETALLDAALLETAPRGRYVEARTASVFAGACHFGGEATTAGREALLAWHFEGGEHAGVALAGVDAALVVAGDANLAEPGAARRSVLYVSERATAAQREAVRALLAGAFAAQLGELVATLSVPLDVAFDAETYRVASPGHFVLRGALLPDRACCRMPFQVWYTPFAPVASAVVGANSEFRCTDARLDRTWSRPDENASFAGSFRYTPRTAAQP